MAGHSRLFFGITIPNCPSDGQKASAPSLCLYSVLGTLANTARWLACVLRRNSLVRSADRRGLTAFISGIGQSSKAVTSSRLRPEMYMAPETMRCATPQKPFEITGRRCPGTSRESNSLVTAGNSRDPAQDLLFSFDCFQRPPRPAGEPVPTAAAGPRRCAPYLRLCGGQWKVRRGSGNASFLARHERHMDLPASPTAGALLAGETAFCHLL